MVVFPQSFEEGVSKYPILATLTRQNFANFLDTVTDDDLLMSQILNRFLKRSGIPFSISSCFHTGMVMLEHNEERIKPVGIPYWLAVLLMSVPLETAESVETIQMELQDVPE